jgi:hypothetical protein
VIAIVIYLVLLVHQHRVADDSLGHNLLAISVRMSLVGAIVAMLGVFEDKDKGLSVIALSASLPILVLMAGWQSIW